MKKKKITFILLNILCIITEYIMIFLFLYKILLLRFIIALIIPMTILIINMLLSKIFTKNIFKDVIIKDDKKTNKYQDKLKPFIEYANRELKTNIKIEYVDLDIRPNPAWCVEDTIYINIAYMTINNELLGMCAHEIGHLYSGLSNYIFLYYFRTTSIIALMINLLIKLICFFVDKNKILKIVGTIFYVPLYISYLVVNLFNHLVIYPFLRNDENFANEIAIKLGYGNELLYYYKMVKYHKDAYSISLQRVVDFEHPTVDKMIKLMEIKINDENINNGYLIYNNILMLCDNNEEKINIPINVLTIDYDAFLFKENTKIILADNLEKILSFKNLKQLTKIYAPRLNSFSTNIFIICKNLETIEINNPEGIYLLGLSYLKINNQDMARQMFEKNDNHKLSLKELLKLYQEEELILLTHQKLAELEDIVSIKYLIKYYEEKEQYDIAMNYINNIYEIYPSFSNYKKGEYYYYGYGVHQNIELAKEYLVLSSELEAIKLLQELNKGEEE